MNRCAKDLFGYCLAEKAPPGANPLDARHEVIDGHRRLIIPQMHCNLKPSTCGRFIPFTAHLAKRAHEHPSHVPNTMKRYFNLPVPNST